MEKSTTTLRKVVVTSTAVTGAVLTVPLVADAALGDDTLYPSMQSEDVKELQSLLKDKGYYTYGEITGYYGEHTKRAVRDFQRDHQLIPDGIAGPKTFAMLFGGETKEPEVRASSTEEARVTLGGSTILRLGEESEEVKELQRQLAQLGFFRGEKTGYYGRQTREAVRNFQRSHQLVVDGIAGPKTFAALKSALSGQVIVDPPEGISSATFKVLERGDQNNQVSQLQQQLKDAGYYHMEITGIFGPQTEKAVRAFQRDHQLTVDGIAGPKTFNQLKQASSKVESIEKKQPNTNGILRFGAQGNDVRTLQSQLKQLGLMKMEPTGVYGEVTENAVRSFQQQYGLTVDGIAGPQTKQALEQAIYGEPPKKEETKQPSANKNINVTNLIADAAEHIGTPYVWGGTTTSGFDCSGFLQFVFGQNGISLPRTVAGIYDHGTSVQTPQVGDIVFFETYQSGPSHAGIYIGNNEFIHAGTSTGVTIANLNTSYWSERYLGAKRYF